MKRLASCSLRYTHTAVNKSKRSCKSKKNWQRVLFDDVNTRVCMRRHIMGSDPVRANPCDKVSVSRSLSVPYSFYICDMPSVALPCIMGLQMRPAFTQSHFLLHWLCQTPTTAAPARWVGGERRIQTRASERRSEIGLCFCCHVNLQSTLFQVLVARATFDGVCLGCVWLLDFFYPIQQFIFYAAIIFYRERMHTKLLKLQNQAKECRN